MDIIKRTREYIKCPQFGDPHYGRWGTLSLEQRKTIKQLCDIIEEQDKVIRKIKCQAAQLEVLIDRIIEDSHPKYPPAHIQLLYESLIKDGCINKQKEKWKKNESSKT